MVGQAAGKLVQWFIVRAVDSIFVLVGIVTLGIGLILWSAQRPIEGGVLTTGQIVDQVTRFDSQGTRMTFPVIEFTDLQEQTHQFESEIGGGGGVQGTIGQVVKVRYDPEEPARAQWADQPDQWVPLAVAGLGAILLLIQLGLIARRLVRRQRHKGEAAHQ